MILSTFIILGFSLGLLEAPAHAKWPPEVQWQEVQTKHFDVHFSSESKKFADTLLPELEAAYEKLSLEFSWNVASHIQVVVDSFHDQSNGASSAFPENRIVLRPVPFEAAGVIGEYEDWIRSLVVHEMTHLMSLDLTRNFFSWMRTVFGSAAKMNVFEPAWMQEGLATYFETRMTDGGRGRSIFFDQVFRTAAREGLFHAHSYELGMSIDRLSDGAPVWPAGESPYLFGYAISAEMAETKGIRSLIEIQDDHSGRLPFIIEDLPRKNFRKGFIGIWNDTVAGIENRAELQLEEVKKAKVSEIEWVSQIGRMSAAPVIDSSRLWLIGDSYSEGRALVEIDLKSHQNKILHRFEKQTGKSLQFSQRAIGLIYSRIESFQQFSEFSDLFLYDLKNEIEIQLTQGLRASDPDVTDDFDFKDQKIISGKLIYVKSYSDGNQAIATFDGKNEKVLLKGQDFERYSFPKINSSTGEVVYCLKLRNGLESIRSLYLSGREGRMWVQGTKGEVLTTPSWQIPQEKILFVSSRTGIFNAETLKWGEKRTRITHLETGLFFPVFAKDSKLGAMVYRASGYDFAWVKVIDAESSAFALTSKVLRTPENADHWAREPIIDIDSSSSMLRELLPKYWYPLFELQNEGFSLGATTSGRDARNIHFYEASLSYDSRAPFWTYHLLYDYDGLYPTIEFERSLKNQFIAYLSSSNPQTETSVSSKYFIDDWAIELGATLNESRFQTQRAESGGLRTLFSHTHFSKTPASIDEEVGVLGHHFEVESSGYFVGDDQFAAVSGRSELRLPSLFDRHFLRWVTDGARSTNSNFSAFYFVGGSEASLTRDPKFLLRGYPSGALLGRTILTSNLEYVFPIIDIFRGITTQPFFYERAKAKIFADVGSAEKVGSHSENFKRWPIGVGAQLIQDFKLLFRLPMSFSLGFHQGLSSQDLGESQIQLGLFSRID